MTGPEVSAAWRLFNFNWIPLGAGGAALAASFAFGGFSLGESGAVVSFGFVAVYLAFAYYNALAPHRRDPQVVFVLGSTAQIVLTTVVMAPLTYVAAAANLPMQDANLLAIDRALGLDWRAYVEFVNARPFLADCVNYGYTMIKWPLFAIPVVLAAARRFEHLQRFTLAFALALIVTTIVSAFVPAIGAYRETGLPPEALANLRLGAYLDQLRDLPPVRDGSLRTLELFGLAGIVTFPSFHAASAALYLWALWPVRWVRPFALFANVLMMAATPANGGHYFIDLVAGVAVAALAIVAARRIGEWLERRSADPATADAPNVAPASTSSAVLSDAPPRSLEAA